MEFNFGDLLDCAARAVPGDRPATVHGDQVLNWAEFDHRTNNLAAAMRARGAKSGDKVAIYMRNRPEYPQGLAACFKARLVPVNVNYRYLDDELYYIFDNSDAVCVIYAREFAQNINRLRPRLPKVLLWIQVEDGHDEENGDNVDAFEGLAKTGDGAPLDIERSPDDQLFIYTGGTTGMPKGVMWRSGDLREISMRGTLVDIRVHSLAEHAELIRSREQYSVFLPCCPIMHGTGLLPTIGALVMGGTVVTAESPSLDADEIWRLVAEHGVTQLALVGDAFGRPMLNALESGQDYGDLSCLGLMFSSGVMWSRENKLGLLKYLPKAVLFDVFAASEALAVGASMLTAEGETTTAKFALGEQVKVFDEDDNEVLPGSGVPGIVGRCGPIPLGYYKDEKKTAETFRTIDGVRYSLPGDWCLVEADGTLTLLGRGSVSINSGGEKIYPEEIEEVLKQHRDVADALVVGLPDETWGQAVTGIVELRNGCVLDEGDLRSHVRGLLAAYKVPKRIVSAEIALRAANGKADYKQAKAFAAAAVAG
ncbi:MAG: acyl-CoA synthetase [Rhodospirillaceae bacterium]|nr:acyl-CoA synthetase [Rhodospirillaceae bacterium]MBT5191756.1 acyl-CoA synthetase [Rhodospirillaceae bacterium]MBT5895314.1 acyl-CoA synthetase [Rhodospirillaceae bacterium]MBT7758011.1 acyl-CoA synthetase [Rhodospirillaceae bacterium]